MANRLKSPPAKLRAFGLVRDKNGKPKFDDIRGIHPELWRMLTDAEKQEITDNGGYPANGIRS